MLALGTAAGEGTLLGALSFKVLYFLVLNLVWVEVLLVLFLLFSRDTLTRFSGVRRLDPVLRGLAEFASRPVAPYCAAALLAVAPRLLFLPFAPPPEPLVPDEFSHRFLADTLLSGRFANPTHPLWVHFETLHIFHTPSYSSMYLPGVALFLAAGKGLTGHHWAGVLLSAAFAAPAVLWMLRALLPAPWAALGALFFVLRTCLSGYWMESYWGGFVAAGAGALAIGATLRFRTRPAALSGAALAIGVSLLAWTRPFEGFVLTLACGVTLLWALVKRVELRPCAVRFALPALAVLAASGAFTLAYNRAVTGDPFKLPYSVNRELYDWPLSLAWFEPRSDVVYRHDALRQYHDFEIAEHNALVRPENAAGTLLSKIVSSSIFFAGPLLLLPVLLALRRRWSVPQAGTCAAMGVAIFAAMAVEQSTYPHYIAPATGLIYLALAASWRALDQAGQRGLLMATGALFVAVCMTAPALRAAGVHVNREGRIFDSWCDPPWQGRWRAEALKRLEAAPGKHLVLVRYNRQSFKTLEWVYNAPDIDASKVVWARDMGAGNQPLLDFFQDRQVWLAEPDAEPPALKRVSLRNEPSPISGHP